MFLCAVLLSACVNPLKLLEADKPERAYEVSKRQIDRRLSNDKPLRERELLALRESYRWLQDLQIGKVEAIERNGGPDRWLSLYPIYQDLLHRRQDIDAYLSLIPRLQLRYDITTLEALTERSRLEAGKYCYEEALLLSPLAREGDKVKARAAYNWLVRSIEYVPEELSYQELRNEMYDWGTVRVAAFTNDRTSWDYPLFTECAIPPDVGVFREGWLEVHTIATQKRIDYDLVVDVHNIYVGGNQESAHTTSYSKEIQDGCETIEKEVTVGDSTYTVTETVPIFITVYGEITEVEQSKSAQVDFGMQLIPINGRAAGNIWQDRSYASWSNDFSECDGDSRALPSCCFGSWCSYPSDQSMVKMLGRSMHNYFLAELCRYFPESRRSKRRNSGWFARRDG